VGCGGPMVGQVSPLPRAHHLGSQQRDNFHQIKY
jgi:hypothetical protein